VHLRIRWQFQSRARKILLVHLHRAVRDQVKLATGKPRNAAAPWCRSASGARRDLTVQTSCLATDSASFCAFDPRVAMPVAAVHWRVDQAGVSGANVEK